MNLIITGKWNPHYLGYVPIEEKYVEYLKTKNFVYCTIDLNTDDTLEQLNEFIYFNTNMEENVKLSLAKNIYTYKNRTFANLNNGFEKLQQKFKNYQKKKMAYCKNPRNLRNREITGKFLYH
tara:strand:- start:4614 stop:4979 length:366 start_codon:yes stop_codon:yes gene_type:complete